MRFFPLLTKRFDCVCFRCYLYVLQVRRRPGVGSLSHQSIYSIAIRRKRNTNIDDSSMRLHQNADGIGESEEWSYEELLPFRLLMGLIPDSLLDQFQVC